MPSVWGRPCGVALEGLVNPEAGRWVMGVCDNLGMR